MDPSALGGTVRTGWTGNDRLLPVRLILPYPAFFFCLRLCALFHAVSPAAAGIPQALRFIAQLLPEPVRETDDEPEKRLQRQQRRRRQKRIRS